MTTEPYDSRKPVFPVQSYLTILREAQECVAWHMLPEVKRKGLERPRLAIFHAIQILDDARKEMQVTQERMYAFLVDANKEIRDSSFRSPDAVVLREKCIDLANVTDSLLSELVQTGTLPTCQCVGCDNPAHQHEEFTPYCDAHAPKGCTPYPYAEELRKVQKQVAQTLYPENP